MPRGRLAEEHHRRVGRSPGRDAGGRLIAAAPVRAVDDPEGVFGEYEALYREAAADGSVDALRRVYEVARVARSNGYEVPWHSVPLLMALSALEIDANAADRRKLRAEMKAIYADIKPVIADA